METKMSPENRGSNRENINFAMQKSRTGVTPEGFKMPVPGKHDHDKKPVDHHIVKNTLTVGSAVFIGLGIGVTYDQGMKNGWFDNFNGIIPPANTDTPTPGGQESPTPSATVETSSTGEITVTLAPSQEATKAPTPTVEVTKKPTVEPTKKATPTPEIVVKNVWDKINRATLASYKKNSTSVEINNPFGIGVGGTTAMVLKDASGNDAPFFVVKDGTNGFSEPIFAYVKQAVEKCNQIDSNLVSGYFKNLDCISGDINGEKLTESRGFGASFLNYKFANTIFINGSQNCGLLTMPSESAVKQVVFFLITEKCGLDYFNGASNGGRTVGVYKAEQGKVKFKELYDQGKINQTDWDFYAWNCDRNRKAAIDGGY